MRKRYTPIYFKSLEELQEGFKSGSNQKVMKLLASILKKRTGMILDVDIPEGYQNNLGNFRAYNGYTRSGGVVRINFLLSNSDYVHSFNLFKKDSTEVEFTAIFDTQTNIIEVINTITDAVNGNLKFNEENEVELEEAKRRKSAKSNAVKAWITDEQFKKDREEMIQKEKFSVLFNMFIKTTTSTDKLPSVSTFSKFVKEYLTDNGMTNPNIRAKVKKTVATVDIPTILPEEKPVVAKHKESAVMMFDWRIAFEDLQDQFDTLMMDRALSPYGQVVWGNGGTGKSYYYNKLRDKFNMIIKKGSFSAKEVVDILYKNRDADVIIFDDSDKVVTDKNAANILKAALDDTVGESNNGTRHVYPTSLTDKVRKEYDLDVENGTAFSFNASIVIITNLTKVPDQALWTRLYKAPIFMTKRDIIEKINETTDPTMFGCTKAMGIEVADFIAGLVESGDFDIRNEQLSYRVYKRGLQFNKHFGNRWKGKLMREFGIGVRTGI